MLKRDYMFSNDRLSPFFLAEGSCFFQDSPISSDPAQEAVFMPGQLKYNFYLGGSSIDDLPVPKDSGVSEMCS